MDIVEALNLDHIKAKFLERADIAPLDPAEQREKWGKQKEGIIHFLENVAPPFVITGKEQIGEEIKNITMIQLKL